MRGLAMVLMALSHSQDFWYAWDDSAELGQRWVTHWTELATPTFLSLGGMMMAVAAMRRRERGRSLWSSRLFYIRRGAVLIILDQTWASFWFSGPRDYWGSFWHRFLHSTSVWRPLGLHWLVWAAAGLFALWFLVRALVWIRRGGIGAQALRFAGVQLLLAALSAGAVIAGLRLYEPLPFVKLDDSDIFYFGILSCTGSSMIVAALLFRLPGPVLIALGWALLRWYPDLARHFDDLLDRWPGQIMHKIGTDGRPWLVSQARHVLFGGDAAVDFPLAVWMGFLIQGLGFGRLFVWLDARRWRAWPVFLIAGLMLMGLFIHDRVHVTGLTGETHKNVFQGTGLQEWTLGFLHARKYPPSWDYCLGMGAVIFTALGLLMIRFLHRDAVWTPLRVLQAFGRVPLFFYLAHLPLIASLDHFTDVSTDLSLSSAVLIWLAVLALLLYPCRFHHWLKRTRRWKWLHYV